MPINNNCHFKLDENVFIETSIQSVDYDGVILILYHDELEVEPPRIIKSFLGEITKLDKHVHKLPTVWQCSYVAGGRLILAPTGEITPYHDTRFLKETAKNGMKRALDAGVTKPLLVVQNVVRYPEGQLVCILGALEALYTPLQRRERKNTKTFIKLGFHAEENYSQNFEKVVRNALALEISRVLTRDIAGSDPERMTPVNIVDYVKKAFVDDRNINIKVIENDEVISYEYPLLAAVNRAANRVERHKARIVEIEYVPTNANRITETLMLVGKGVTYDTGGANIKTDNKMSGMSGDKSGAAAVVGFVKACSLLKPTHLKVLGVLCICRNSVGEDSYVADEIVISKSGKAIRVTNTDAEGRFAMADVLYKLSELAMNELNPHLYTIATLTGHARACYGSNTAAMDNHSARATSHASRLQFSGSKISEGIEVSVLRPEDFDALKGQSQNEDLLQHNGEYKRGHQFAAAFLIAAGGLQNKNIKYTHLDIAGSAGYAPHESTAVPILSLCLHHKVLL